MPPQADIALVVDLGMYIKLFGVADSSAAFGVGMTRTIEQGDPKSFSANCEAEPFQSCFLFRRGNPHPDLAQDARLGWGTQFS
jgi:hypothetical protein